MSFIENQAQRIAVGAAKGGGVCIDPAASCGAAALVLVVVGGVASRDSVGRGVVARCVALDIVVADGVVADGVVADTWETPGVDPPAGRSLAGAAAAMAVAVP